MTQVELRDYDLLGNLDDESDVLDSFVSDYTSSSGYVCDLVSEKASDACPIYNNEIWANVADIQDYIEEAVTQGLYDVRGRDFDLVKLFSAGYYEYYSQSLGQNISNMAYNIIANQVNEFLNELDEDVVSMIDLGLLEYHIGEYADDFDWNERMSSVIERAEEFIEYIKENHYGGFDEIEEDYDSDELEEEEEEFE